MTNERSFPQGRPEGTPADGRACPDSQMLSEYLDGKLAATERDRIEDHISRCEDCYFVVKETSALQAENGAEGVGLGGVDAPPGGASIVEAAGGLGKAGPARHSFVARHLLPMAAALIVGVGAVALWRQTNVAGSYEESVKPLVDAVGERRFFEPRLTGGFKYGPTISFKRAAGSGPESETWGVLAVAGEITGRAATASIVAKASRAAAALFAGDVEGAVAGYSQLVRDEPGAAAWASNLAAALMVRASRRNDGAGPQNDDILKALEFAEKAHQLEPGLDEARFNRALALEMLSRTEESRRAFEEIAARGHPWSGAARDHLRNGPEPAASRR